LFLNGRFATNYRERLYIDGSFLAFEKDYHIPTQTNRIWFNWKKDPYLVNKGLADFIKTVPKDFIWNLFMMGSQYAKYMDQQGDFTNLVKR